MPSPFRPLTGLYLSFINNQPLVNAEIKIKLSKNDYDLSAGFPVEEQSVFTTATGNLPDGLMVWASAVGYEGAKVVFTEPDGFKWEVAVPAGLNPISVQELRAMGTVVTPPETVISLIEATDLGDLHDVEFSAPAEGEAVVWDAVQSKWVNRTLAGGGGSAVSSVNGRTGAVVLAKNDVGLNNVNNTADANKPISNSTQAALDGKQASLGFTPMRSAVGSPRPTTAIWCGTTAQLAVVNPRDPNTLYVEI